MPKTRIHNLVGSITLPVTVFFFFGAPSLIFNISNIQARDLSPEKYNPKSLGSNLNQRTAERNIQTHWGKYLAKSSKKKPPSVATRIFGYVASAIGNTVANHISGDQPRYTGSQTQDYLSHPANELDNIKNRP